MVLHSIGSSHILSNWSFVYQISINTLISKPRKVTHGVHQGLFLVHSYSISIYFPYLKLLTNHNPHYRSIVDYHSYTDDILHCRLIDPNNAIHLLNNCITDIHNRLTNNSVSLNCLKTESLMKLNIKTSTTIFLSPQITINNLSIYYANKVKTLGILIDPTLKFHIPTKSQSQSINYILQNLRTIIPFINFNTAIFLLHPSFDSTVILNLNLKTCRFLNKYIKKYVRKLP